MNSTYRSMMYSAFFMQYLNQNSELSAPCIAITCGPFLCRGILYRGLLYRDLLYSESVRWRTPRPWRYGSYHPILSTEFSCGR